MAAKQADAARRGPAEEAPTTPAPGARLRGLFNLDRLPYWLLLFAILLGAGAMALVLALIFPWDSTVTDLPFAVRSPLRADYSADPRGAVIAQVDMSLVGQVLRDHPGEDANMRLATIVQGLNTPVPTVTPRFSQTGQATSTPTIVVPPTRTRTTAPLTSTPAASATLTPSASPTVFIPTARPPTRAPTRTPSPAAPTDLPTDTPPPTETPPPTATEPPPPTETLPPDPTEPSYPPPPPPTAYPGPTG